MKVVNLIKHIAITAAALIIILGIPALSSDTVRAYLRGEDPDAVSSSTVILDAPSGSFVALINEEKRKDADTLATWKKFFSGEEIGFVFEDIVCGVGRGDSAAKEMAQSLQSRLPENQMRIEVEDATLMLSKAEYGRFDIILMSVEYAKAFGIKTVEDNEGVTAARLELSDSGTEAETETALSRTETEADTSFTETEKETEAVLSETGAAAETTDSSEVTA